MSELIAILASVITVSLIAFIGIIFIGLKENILRRVLVVLVGLASGTLLGAAFLHLLPEAAENNATLTPFFYVIIGIVFFFGLEKFLYWRHCHEGECPVHMFVYLNLFGDGIHNFIDGMIIAAAFLGSFDLGFVVTLAVIFHEIPQEIGDFGVLIYGGFSRKRALAYNFLSALTAILGASVAYFLANAENISVFLVPFAAGGFIYIAAADLMPEMHKKHQGTASFIQLMAIVSGIALMAYLKIFIGA